MGSKRNLSKYFLPEVRIRGFSSYLDKRGYIMSKGEFELRAKVVAQVFNQVKILKNPEMSDTVGVTCSCHAFKNGHYCQHIWTTILLIDNQHPEYLFGYMSICRGEYLKKEEPAKEFSRSYFPIKVALAIEYFRKLGVQVQLPLNGQFRKTLMRKIHPDVGGDPEIAKQANAHIDLLEQFQSDKAN